MNLRRYLWKGTVFSFAGTVAFVVDMAILYTLTSLGLWYMYSAAIGTILAGLVHYNLNIVTGNISVAGKVAVGAVCQHPGCTAAAEIQCACGQLLCLEHHQIHT